MSGSTRKPFLPRGCTSSDVLQLLNAHWNLPLPSTHHIPTKVGKDYSREDKYFLAVENLHPLSAKHMELAIQQFAARYDFLVSANEFVKKKGGPDPNRRGPVLRIMIECLQTQIAACLATRTNDRGSWIDSEVASRASLQTSPSRRTNVPAVAVEQWREGVPLISESSSAGSTKPQSSDESRFADVSHESMDIDDSLVSEETYHTSNTEPMLPPTLTARSFSPPVSVPRSPSAAGSLSAASSPSVGSASSIRSLKSRETKAAQQSRLDFSNHGRKPGEYKPMDVRSISECSELSIDSLKRKEHVEKTATTPLKKAKTETNKGKGNAKPPSREKLPVLKPEELNLTEDDFPTLKNSPRDSPRKQHSARNSLASTISTMPNSFETKQTSQTSATSFAPSPNSRHPSFGSVGSSATRQRQSADTDTDEDTDRDDDSFIANASAYLKPAHTTMPPPPKPLSSRASERSAVRAASTETTPEKQILNEQLYHLEMKRTSLTTSRLSTVTNDTYSTVHRNSTSEPETIPRNIVRGMAEADIPSSTNNVYLYDCPFHVVYEATRVALATDHPLDDRKVAGALSAYCHPIMKLLPKSDSHKRVWDQLKVFAGKGKTMPEQIQLATWDKLNELSMRTAWEWDDGCTLSGDAMWDKIADASSDHGRKTYDLTLDLNPITFHGMSDRFVRKFGSHRFLTLRIPSIEKRLPGSMTKLEAQKVMHRFKEHGFQALGRTWKALYPKEQSQKKPSPLFDRTSIMFFAVQGHNMKDYGFDTIEKVIDWHISFEENKSMTLAKFCSRIKLGFSGSRATVEFESVTQIRKIKDFLSPIGEPMDDGCCIASPAFFRTIAEMTDQPLAPSAVQGRIGGAKGVWMIDLNADPESKDLYIYVNDSQSKYKRHRQDKFAPDRHRLTFDLLMTSHAPRKASMNTQFIVILEHRGVPRSAIEELMREDIDRDIGELLRHCEDVVCVKSWLETKAAESRKGNSSIPLKCAQPASYAEQAIELFDAGFTIKNCTHLRDVFKDIVKDHCEKLKDKLHIQVPKSTQAFCVCDPTGELEEGEIFFRFSEPLTDEKTKRNIDQVLGDVIVARNPAHLASDIRKVRAVDCFKLRHLQDVVVFSRKGDYSLASYLAGGDYDGDKPWVCWDPRLVKHFENHEIPTSEYYKSYYFDEDKTTVGQFMKANKKDFAQKLVSKNLNNSSQESRIGIATTYHVNYTYAVRNINDVNAVHLAKLIADLHDAAKGGLVLKEQAWKSVNDGFRKYPEPAYKLGKAQPLKPGQRQHIVDYLKMDVAKNLIDEIFQGFDEQFNDAVDDDLELIDFYDSARRPLDEIKRSLSEKTGLESIEQRKLENAREVLEVIFEMNKQLDNIWRKWNGMHGGISSEDLGIDQEIREKQAHCKLSCFQDYKNILPLSKPANPLVESWRQDADKDHSYWNQLKASALYKRSSKKLVWNMAAHELCYLKSGQQGLPVRHILEPLYMVLKTRKSAAKEREGGDDCGDTDEYDGC